MDSTNHRTRAEQLISQVKSEVTRLMAVAEEYYGKPLIQPVVRFTKKGTTAGVCDNIGVNYNAVLLVENGDNFIARTVPHEIAHWVDKQINPDNFTSTITTDRHGNLRRTKRELHGQSFKFIMGTVLGAKDTSTCHRFDTTNSKIHKTTTKYVYVCHTCGEEMHLGHKRHKRMSSGQTRYWLKSCGPSHHFVYHKKLVKRPPTQTSHRAAADAPRPKRSGTSKLDKCRAIFDIDKGRAWNIQAFMDMGCSKAGASTYYQNIKKERGL